MFAAAGRAASRRRPREADSGCAAFLERACVGAAIKKTSTKKTRRSITSYKEKSRVRDIDARGLAGLGQRGECGGGRGGGGVRFGGGGGGETKLGLVPECRESRV